MSDRFVQRVQPEAAFAALADGTRLEILRVLWESGTETATFSELRRGVGMRDPGQFNYHLDKLVGQFVVKTEGGYRLTQAGKHVNGAIASGLYTTHGISDPIALPHSCRVSGEPLLIRYENETVRVGCDPCSRCPSGWEAPIPPAAFAGYGRDEIPTVVSRYFRTKVQQVTNGFCPYCDGRMNATVTLDVATEERAPNAGSSDAPPLDPVVRFDCRRCSAESRVALDHALLVTDPAVAEFYYRNGIVVRDHTMWELAEFGPERVEVERRDPLVVVTTFQVDVSTVSIAVDETFTVVDDGPSVESSIQL